MSSTEAACFVYAQDVVFISTRSLDHILVPLNVFYTFPQASSGETIPICVTSSRLVPPFLIFSSSTWSCMCPNDDDVTTLLILFQILLSEMSHTAQSLLKKKKIKILFYDPFYFFSNYYFYYDLILFIAFI